MLLIGMYDSPFVRRVAISLKLCGIAFEHGDWSVGADFERIRQYNPLVRVPTLVLDDGEVLLESQALLDYLDELVGPQRALLPRAGSRAAQRAQAHGGGNGRGREGARPGVRARLPSARKTLRALAGALPHADAWGAVRARAARHASAARVAGWWASA